MRRWQKQSYIFEIDFKSMFFRINKSLSEFDDSELLDKFKSDGDIKYASELFLRYKSLIYGVCLKYLKSSDEAKDASMEIFEELNRKIGSHDVKNFKSWLYALVRNHCLMQLRSNQRHKETELSEKDEPIVMEFPMEMHPIEEREIKYMQLASALDELDEFQAKCLKMFYLENNSYQDIVETTGIDLKKVKSYIQNGKRNLKIKLDSFE